MLAVAQKNYLDQALETAFSDNDLDMALRQAADAVEAYLKAGNYAEVLSTAEQIERESYYTIPSRSSENFSLFRIFANKAEALNELGEPSRAKRAREKAFDYQLESSADVDIEMLQLMSR